VAIIGSPFAASTTVEAVATAKPSGPPNSVLPMICACGLIVSPVTAR